MDHKHLSQLGLPEIIQGCIEESERFRAGQSGKEGHCFELFRRAIENDDQRAWSAIHEQYYRLVIQWIGGQYDSEELSSSAFFKFWRTLQGIHLSHRFKHVGAVLAYLRKCAMSVRLDWERKKQRAIRETSLNKQVTAWDNLIETLALERITRDERRRILQSWLEKKLSDTQERLVIFLSYALDLSPSEIAQNHPEQFKDARTVRRIKERVLKRLRRAQDLRDLIEY
jgi:RNA polymerase sigma factor (sigma-70 family)